jgi:hypothetical protein
VLGVQVRFLQAQWKRSEEKVSRYGKHGGGSTRQFTPTEGGFKGISEFWRLTESPIPCLSGKGQSPKPIPTGEVGTAHRKLVHSFPNLFDTFAIATLLHPRDLRQSRSAVQLQGASEFMLPPLEYDNGPEIRARQRSRNPHAKCLVCVVEGCRRANGRTRRLWLASYPGTNYFSAVKIQGPDPGREIQIPCLNAGASRESQARSR